MGYTRYHWRNAATPVLDTPGVTTSTAFERGRSRVQSYLYPAAPMSERRRFNDRERAALYLAADGRCMRCAEELRPGWHADHEVAYSRGGKTDVLNGQALCPRCNLLKGDGDDVIRPLRRWQADAIREFDIWRAGCTPDTGFLAGAQPGAGKTTFAITVAKRMLESGRITRVVVVVPTNSLETQWAEEFEKEGVNVDPDWKAKNTALAPDVVGFVVTYAEVPFNPDNVRIMVGKVPTLVIFDEVHHCGDQRSWGKALRRAFDPAAYKLLLSGTPYRSDGSRIPYVEYEPAVDEDGRPVPGATKPKPNVLYTYREALADGVVRSVFFPRRGGQAEWEWHGKLKSASFEDELNDEEANRRLRTVLSPAGDWLPAVLADADRQLYELRETDPRAAGIVFCEDSAHAAAIANILYAMGRDPVVAISDDPKSDDLITAFKKSRDPWIIAIRKVSEGVDIPRLRVGVWATNWLTALFFDQAVGRILRSGDEDDPTAYMFLPDDPRLRKLAQTMRDARDLAMMQKEAEQLDLFDQADYDEPDEPNRRSESSFRPVSSSMADMGTLIGDWTPTVEEMAYAERVRDTLTNRVSRELVAEVLKKSGHWDITRTTSPAPETSRPPRHERVKTLRRDANTRVAYIANKFGMEHSDVRGYLNAAVGLPRKGGAGSASEDQLKQVLKLAREWAETGKPPVGRA